MAAEIMDDSTLVDYRIKISGKAPLKEHKGKFNAPSVSEVTIMIAGELDDRRDITFSLECQSKGLANPKKGVPLADFPGYVTDNALGRVYTVHPNNREAFHMRLLLHHVRGSISFGDLKIVIVRDEDNKIPSITSNKLALYGLPEPVYDQPELTSKDVLRKTSYDVQALRAYMAASVPRLTPDHQQAFIAITGIIGSERGEAFSFWMHQIGDGKVPEDPSTGFIIMRCDQIVNSPDEFLSKVYPNIQQNFKDQDWLSHKEILASRNDVVEKLNVTIQKQLSGQENMPTSPQTTSLMMMKQYNIPLSS
ncbi:hypothetical protein TNIN_2681 [Trichonephila inaurata madagascariensis]|uniref:Uncharacterized protein n=1 Tax=Trichonephila inaurata madagascariensis TaxID=2747483 RepID=A0A8X6MAS1_9ARAC|nr:hypothetical protein TNIN_2681 [Trichonephila inaurata madagascariensis]